MKVNREELLGVFESVRPGLSVKDVLEQSACIILKDGFATTFNDELSARCPTGLDGIEGAVRAAPLLAVLHKMPEDEVTIEQGDGELVIVGKKRRAGIKMEAEIFLALDQLDTPEEWVSLHEEYGEALGMVHECAGTDLKSFVTACVHLHPKWMEAFDNRQLMRYRIKTGVSAPTLVKRDGLKHVATMGADQFSETASWVHYKNPSGLILSCRRFMEEFIDLSPEVTVEGTPIKLPKGLAGGLDIAGAFAAENADNKSVMVELRDGKMRVRGQGTSGWYTEVKAVAYSGPRMTFYVAPALLKQITTRHNEAYISETRLKVKGDKWVYICCLGTPDQNGGE